MAGVVSSEGVLDSELTFTLPSSDDSESLQDLIDSELAALRIKEAAEAEAVVEAEAEAAPAPLPDRDTGSRQQERFLEAERDHSASWGHGQESREAAPAPAQAAVPEPEPEPESPESPAPEHDHEPEPESSQEADPVTVVGASEGGHHHDSTSSLATNEEDDQSVLVEEITTTTATTAEGQEVTITTTTTRETMVTTEQRTVVIEKQIEGEVWTVVERQEETIETGGPEEAVRAVAAEEEVPMESRGRHSPDPPQEIVLEDLGQEDISVDHSSWTTVEEAARDMLDCCVPATTQDNAICCSEETETIITEKKTKKKKTTTTSESGGEVSSTKVKKTKKSKKSEEKENHISVITNGHDESRQDDSPTVSSSTNDDDELSNVCVKELKLTYVSEAAKSYNSQPKPSEEPVLPTVPIRELRRSFGDIHRACEENDFVQSGIKEKQMRARSLGDLTGDDKKPVVTGVNVRQLKSSFSKFDQLSKKAVFHVRSSDTSKAQKTFSQSGTGPDGASATCKSCGKTVFAMEQIKAERAVWHKNCFRCKTCNKQLTVDIYSSHEGELYCKPHFKELFQPKAVLDGEEPTSDKADLGLEELSALNVKSRFQVFEKNETSEEDHELAPVNVKRSPSILSKLARFQKKGMDIGVTDEALNGYKYEETSSEEEDEEGEEDADEEEKGVIKCRKIRERPMSFNKLDDVKKNWECGQSARKDELREERKQEIQHIRSRLFMGKQGKMKEMYEQAVAESEGRASKKELDTDVVKSEKAKAVREKFEKGETIQSESDDEKSDKQKLDEDMSVFEEGISKKSRSIFLEMDSAISKSSSTILPTPKPIIRDQAKVAREVQLSRQASEDIVKSSDRVEDITVETADLSSKFRFFETYKAPEVRKKTFRITPPREGAVKSESPERDVYRDPDVVRSDDKVEDEHVVLRSQTASKMLSIFRQMEEQKEVLPDGPKPKKCFTPPPDYKEDRSGSSEEESEEGSEEEDEEEEEESEDDTGIIRSSHKIKDEFLEQARNAARAKALAAKFEHWEPEKQSINNAITMLESDAPSIDSTKSLCARFESLKTEQPKEKQRPKINRFVELPPVTSCASCQNKVYPLEKIEASGKIFHKACFRCTQCKTVLRMDSYTLNNGHLYCMPHFKQLFITKGNYDEGFGLDQHKRKWEATTAQSLNGST